MFFKRLKIVALTFSIVVGLLNYGNCAYLICYAPDCPSDTQAPKKVNGHSDKNTIERTFLKSKSLKSMSKGTRKPKRFIDDCINPELPVVLNREHMEDLMSIGNKITRGYTTLDTFFIDVGVAGNDTQYWSFPSLEFENLLTVESIDTSQSGWSFVFPTSNYATRGLDLVTNDTLFAFYEMNDSTFARDGTIREDETTADLLDWYSTLAFLPIECGWIIEETVTTIYPFDPDIDSTVEVKLFTVQSTGMLTPINEDPVKALLGFEAYFIDEYKDGDIIYSNEYESFTWFSEKGHRIIGYLEPGAPYEGVTQFQLITYDVTIPSCPPIHDIGIDPGSGVYTAQNEIMSGASWESSPVEFVTSQEIILKNGFSTSGEMNLLIDPDPCNF